jgi:oxygen-independent coproporphyrinogen-3 oxidase
MQLPVNWKRITETMCNKTLGIYIHVPFCAVKCPYCDFYSVSYSKKNEMLYTEAVIRNLEKYSHICSDRIIDTIYFGGGTPSILSPENIKKILFSTYKLFNVENSAEISMEANPNTLNEKKCRGFLLAGINRLSVGIQSFNDYELENLGRKHNSMQAENAVLTAYNSGFENISCDFMLGVSGQNIQTLSETLETAVNLPINHISAYMLKIEENTPFNCDEIIQNLPDDDTFADMYLKTVETLENYGFMQYEISNFSKKGFESRHNLKYWKCEEYIGIAPSAHSYLNGNRYNVPSDLNQFVNNIYQTEIQTDDISGNFEEKAMLALRLKSGLEFDMCGEKKADIIKKSQILIKNGLADMNNDKLWLTPKGFLVSNQIIEFLVL